MNDAAEPSRPPRRWRWAELNWAVAWSAGLAVITLLPYLAGASQMPAGQRYLGFVFNPDEPNVHLSWIRQASEGAVFFRNEFTSEPHSGRFFNLFMLACGRAAAAAQITPYQVWAAARMVAVVLFGLACYVALIDYTSRARRRRFALAVITLSSGMGWYAVGRGLPYDTIDAEPGLVMPEAISFLHLYLNPLFTTSAALLVLVIACGYRALARRSWPAAAAGGFAGLILANMHTYDAVPQVAVLTAYLVLLAARERRWDWPRFGRWGLIVGLTLPAVAYQAHLIRSDALYALKANTPTLTPAPVVMLLSYGLLTPLALLGAWTRLRRGHRPAEYWSCWALVHGLCLYLPAALVPFQRKMAEGLHVPLAVLAAGGLAEVGRWLGTQMAVARMRRALRDDGATWAVRVDCAMRRESWRAPVMVIGLLLLLPSNILFLQSTMDALRTNNDAKLRAWMPPFAVPEPDWQAMVWMSENVPHGVVLCLPPVGSYLPGFAGQAVFCGHWAETLGFGDRLKEAGHFFRGGGTAAEKTAFLRENHVTHVFYGTYERMFTNDTMPRLPELRQVYPEGAGRPGPVTVFAVEPKPAVKP